MGRLQYETMFIAPLATPMKPHTIELLEPIERVVCVTVCWALKYYSEGSPFVPRDYYLGTLGMDGVD
jgi:hypothetical protein